MKFKVALCQMNVVLNKDDNIKTAERLIREGAANGADIIGLPEIWNSPYSTKHFRKNAELPGEKSYKFMSDMAKELGVYIIGGSIPELEIVQGSQDGSLEPSKEKVYNTCYCFDRTGVEIGKHRKYNLFDVNITGGTVFKESDVFSPGNKITVLDTELGKIGVAICFDVRFPEIFKAMKDVHTVFLPAAFGLTTGPAHWELLNRMRAVDNQVYFASISSARDMSGHYQAWGHSMFTNPWGVVEAEADETEQIVYGEVDLDYVDQVRNEMPIGKQKNIAILY
ncbi:MAG: carbon-nitrogen hydrolase family protein [Anaerovoracaceae bacterium]